MLTLVRGWSVVAHLLSALQRHTAALGESLRDRPAQQVLCHGDPHLGNLLHEGADVVSLVDWDDVVLAPRERDFMFLRGGVLAALPVTAEREAWFMQGTVLSSWTRPDWPTTRARGPLRTLPGPLRRCSMRAAGPSRSAWQRWPSPAA